MYVYKQTYIYIYIRSLWTISHAFSTRLLHGYPQAPFLDLPFLCVSQQARAKTLLRAGRGGGEGAIYLSCTIISSIIIATIIIMIIIMIPIIIHIIHIIIIIIVQ